jgi:DNA-binding MarR family transcriptional regulator
MNLVQLFADLVTEQVDVFDAIDIRLRAEVGVQLIAVLPMRVIDATPGCRIQDVADGVRISPGGASKSADRLEREGLAIRLPNPDDRRSAIIELTDHGRTVLRAGERVIAEEMRARVADVLDAPELDALAVTMRKLRTATQNTDLSPG